MRGHAHLIEHPDRIDDAGNVEQEDYSGCGHLAQALDAERLLLTILQRVQRRASLLWACSEMTRGVEPESRRLSHTAQARAGDLIRS
jgi:hypothetical protein